MYSLYEEHKSMFAVCHVHLSSLVRENKTYDYKAIVIGRFSIPVIQGFRDLHSCLVFLVLPVERK